MRNILGLLFMCVLSTLCLAQTESATLSGRVTDPSGAVIANAEVVFTNMDTNNEQRTKTNGSGIYVFTGVHPGRYRAAAGAVGFKTLIKENLVLHVQDEVVENFALPLGSVSESVTVAGGAPTVETTGMGVGTVIDRKFVDDLPLNGRSFQTLFQLTPGVIATPANFNAPGQFSVSGQRTASNYMTVDGVSANVGVLPGGNPSQAAAGTQMGTTALGGTNSLVSVDALQEFRIQTSAFAPEYGRTPGGQISIVTRSGTNQFHGTAFDYFRNDKLDANNWFANQKNQLRPPERQNDFGGVVGGPILKDRTFFFFSYEGLRLRLPLTVVNSNVPSLTARQSAPDSLKPYLNTYPLPNGPDLGNGIAQLNASFSNPSSVDSTSLRVDHRLGSAWTLLGRFSDAPSSIDSRGTSAINSLNSVTDSTVRTRTLTAGATWIVSPQISNDARFNFATNRGEGIVTPDGFGGAVPLPAALACPVSSAAPGSCQFTLSLTQAGTILTTGAGSSTLLRQLNLTDSLAISRGAHRVAIGGDVRRIHTFPQAPPLAVSASFTGVGPASQIGTILSGISSFVQVTAYPSDVSLAYWNTSFYVQDTWQVQRRLNVTYGLRWDINPAPASPSYSTITGANNASQLALGQMGAPLWSTSYNNLAPRLGFAYTLFSRSGYETVLRGGSGFFYDMVSGQIANQYSGGSNTASLTVTGAAFPGSSIVAPVLPAMPPYQVTLNAVDPALVTPTVYQWNLAIQQGLGTGRSVSLSYLGSRGIHLTRQEFFSKPNQTFANVLLLRTNAESQYNALELQYQQRLSRSVQVLGNYTLSHSIDTASGDVGSLPPGQYLTPHTDKGSSDFDVRQNGSVAVTYALPGPKNGVARLLLGGWSSDGMLIGRSAFPVNIAISRNLGYGTYAYRPDLVSGVSPYLGDPNVAGGQRLNPLAFVAAPDQRQGTLGRNTILGFGMFQLNGGIHKSFHLTERQVLQFRAEFFNLTNHPNFTNPSGNLASVSAAGLVTRLNTFGISSSTLNQGLGAGGSSGGFSPLYQVGGPRSIQLALKLSF